MDLDIWIALHMPSRVDTGPPKVWHSICIFSLRQQGDYMKFNYIFLISLGMSGCFAPMPRPFQVTPVNDSDATSRLAFEESRLISINLHESFRGVTDALLTLGYRITASDVAGGILSFERSENPPRGVYNSKYIYSAAIREGTLHLTSTNPGTHLRLILSGKILWESSVKLNVPARQELDPRLSPEEHKKFFDELFKIQHWGPN